MLVVCGDTIFNGYLGYKGPSPFLLREGRNWYRTGDLVQIDADGFVTFRGRLKRFVKIGGEMVSLPALEDVLLARYPNPDVKGPSLAVEAYGPDSAPVVALVSTLPLDREEVNEGQRHQPANQDYANRNGVHGVSSRVPSASRRDLIAL